MGILLYDMTMKMDYLLIKFFDDMSLKSCKIDESTFALKLPFELHSKNIRKKLKGFWSWTMSDMVKYRAAIWSFLKLTAPYFIMSDIVHKNYNTELVKISDNYIK